MHIIFHFRKEEAGTSCLAWHVVFLRTLMFKKAALSFAACTLLAAPAAVMAAPAPSTDVTVEARFFSPSFDTKVKSDSIKYNNGQVSLKDDLGLSDKNAPELILRYRNMSLDYIHLSNSGSAKLNDTLEVDNKTYQANGSIHTDSKINYLKFTVTNPVLHGPKTELNWNYGISMLNWKLSANGEVNGPGSYTQSASESYTVPIPMVGIGGKAEVANGLDVYATVSGLPLASYGHIYDFEAGLCYAPIENLAIKAGYRKLDIHVHHGDDDGTFSLGGPWAGLSYQF